MCLSSRPTTCTRGSSHSQLLPGQQRGLALSILNLHVRSHFFLELPFTTPGRTLPYLSGLSLVSSRLLPPKVWFNSLLCTSNNTRTLHRSASAYLCVSISHICPLLSTFSEQVLLTAAGHKLLAFNMLTGKKLSHSYQALSWLAHQNQKPGLRW